MTTRKRGDRVRQLLQLFGLASRIPFQMSLSDSGVQLREQAHIKVRNCLLLFSAGPFDLLRLEVEGMSDAVATKSSFVGSSSISKDGGGDLSEVFEEGRHGQTVHIFSIASGYLYERFLKTMILTVLKNTRRKVKFWFLEIYLSPKFKNVLPLMAQAYDFQYEFVSYKWPSWLYQHMEKKQLKWGYKIMFLDVLFPLSLKKVIFIAADVIVRADVGELYDMDLNAKPLACAPICDNNRDMDSYQFWKHAFWRSHLQGKPYHSSALCVVDLVKFRQMTAADTLRTFHETLNKEANNLSRPDQDLLINYAQHSVPIFSLPQEWVWCEPWCENADKTKAKTIYLCKSPIMKEAKLEAASRIIPDWDELNAEAEHFD